MIAFLGLGLLGSNFVLAQLKRGEEVHVWNRSPEKARALEAEGAVAFDDPAEAVRGATRIHVCVSDDAAVDDVLERIRGGLTPGVVIVDHTTTSAEGAAERATRWAKLGTPYLHAPVFMGPQNALDATGTMLVSGDEALVAQVRPALEAMTGRLLYCGPAPDRAAALKLLGNLFFITFTASLADVFALARALDVEESQVGELLDIFNPGTLLAARIQRLQQRDYANPSWNLAMARKDARLMEEAAGAAGVPLLALPGVTAVMDRLLDAGHGDDDWTIVTRDALGDGASARP